MDKQSRSIVIWLRVSYWVGAVADGIVACLMFAQAFVGNRCLLSQYIPEPPYRFAMGLAGSLMVGWTILLLWADRDPVGRRGILIITVIVILGLMASGVLAVSTGYIPLPRLVPGFVFLAGLLALFVSSCVVSRDQ